MDLRLKAYLKAIGLVFGIGAIVIGLYFGAKAISEIAFVRENIKAIIIFLMVLLLFCFAIFCIAEMIFEKKLQKLKPKKRKECKRNHIESLTLPVTSFFIFWLIVLFIILLVTYAYAQQAEKNNAEILNNQSVSTLDIEN